MGPSDLTTKLLQKIHVDTVTSTENETLQRKRISKEMVMGLFEPAEHEDYQKIDITYADESGMYMHQDAYQAFQNMHTAAKQDGIDLIIRSATRNFNRQKQILGGKMDRVNVW